MLIRFYAVYQDHPSGELTVHEKDVERRTLPAVGHLVNIAFEGFPAVDHRVAAIRHLIENGLLSPSVEVLFAQRAKPS